MMNLSLWIKRNIKEVGVVLFNRCERMTLPNAFHGNNFYNEGCTIAEGMGV